MRKKLLAIYFLILIVQTSISASALDTAQTGSIRLTLPGGNIQLYRVGAVEESGGTLRFVPTGDFSGWSGSLDNLQNPTLAEKLASFAQSNPCEYASGIIEKDGDVTFSNLTPGLYLLVQTEAAEGYERIAPFLVSLPANGAGSYNYEIDASPKFQLTVLPTEPLPSLPQTGQLNWPVPILAVSGLSLFLLGWFLQRKRHG